MVLEKRIKEFVVGRSGTQLLSDVKWSRKPVPSIFGASPHPAEVLSSRTLTKLLSKAPETALVNHVVKWGLLREQGRHLNTQVKPLDVTSQMLASTHPDQPARKWDLRRETLDEEWEAFERRLEQYGRLETESL